MTGWSPCPCKKGGGPKKNKQMQKVNVIAIFQLNKSYIGWDLLYYYK
jgi:hypothetical protein